MCQSPVLACQTQSAGLHSRGTKMLQLGLCGNRALCSAVIAHQAGWMAGRGTEVWRHCGMCKAGRGYSTRLDCQARRAVLQGHRRMA